MFNDLPMEGGPCHLPAHPPPGWKERLRARSKIPEVLVNYAKQAPEVSIPTPAQTGSSLQALLISCPGLYR